MENKDQKYWKGLDELNNEPEFAKQRQNEFAEKLPLGNILKEDDLGLNSNRRDFLKFMGFSITAATIAAACTRTPVKKAIPYLIKPEEIDPGVDNFYATTCNGCNANCSLLVKTREGRPIKIDGNPDSPFSQGGVCATGQGTVLSLYDNGRLPKPLRNKEEITWENLDKQVIAHIKESIASGKGVRILSGSINSPSTLSAIKDFSTKYPGTQHIMYDAVSYSGLLQAHKQMFGKALIPDYKFNKAKVIVSFGADFLGTWLSPVEFTKQYSAAKKTEVKEDYPIHMQFESRLSLSGSNADIRATLKPSQVGQALTSLYSKITGGSGSLELAGNTISHAANTLLKYKGRSIVITDSNDPDHQVIVAAINNALGNYGSTLDVVNPSYQRAGNDKDMIQLVTDMNAGKVGTLIIYGVNPSYTYPDTDAFNNGLKKVDNTISFAGMMDETSQNIKYIAPDHHFLESWGDSNPKEGYYSLSQPTITPIFNSRAATESFLVWAEATETSHYDYLKKYWKENMLSKQSQYSDFEDFWEHIVEHGFFTGKGNPGSLTAANTSLVSASVNKTSAQVASKNLEVVLYEKVAIRDGQNSNNPWLMELPDPISKVSWDNYACLSVKWADEHNVTDLNVIKITVNGKAVELPVLRSPGQTYGTVGIAYGYGRNYGKITVKDASGNNEEIIAGKVANGIGANAFPFAAVSGESILYNGATAEISNTGKNYELALTQTHHNMEGRNLILETTIDELPKYKAKEALGEVGSAQLISLWKDYRFPAHHWGMAVDLNACTGCNACVVSCQAENNIPVVGKDEVRRRREMHWIRIDRYYSVAETNHVYDDTKYHDKHLEIDAMYDKNKIDYENVKVAFQPIMCQHCSNAPCETVCPVSAISHSSEGLNQQIYNRCVGTRYCANNCPYKVRRFNWFRYFTNSQFDYTMNNDLSRMVLNPDVTVRSRGVMEKCSFCVQRIQAVKLTAKTESRMLKDGEIKTACMQTCPANAIVFGDLNDPNSEVSKLFANKRSYSILTELNTRPNVSYLAKVRNNIEDLA